MEKGVFRITEKGIEKEVFVFDDKIVNTNSLESKASKSESKSKPTEFGEEGLPSRNDLVKLSAIELNVWIEFLLAKKNTETITAEEVRLWNDIVDEVYRREPED